MIIYKKKAYVLWMARLRTFGSWSERIPPGLPQGATLSQPGEVVPAARRSVLLAKYRVDVV